MPASVGQNTRRDELATEESVHIGAAPAGEHEHELHAQATSTGVQVDKHDHMLFAAHVRVRRE